MLLLREIKDPSRIFYSPRGVRRQATASVSVHAVMRILISGESNVLRIASLQSCTGIQAGVFAGCVVVTDELLTFDEPTAGPTSG